MCSFRKKNKPQIFFNRSKGYKEWKKMSRLNEEKWEEKGIKEQVSGRKMMTVGDSFKCLKIVIGIKAMNRKTAPQARNPWKE